MMETLSDKFDAWTQHPEPLPYTETNRITDMVKNGLQNDVKEFIKKLKELGDQAHKMIDELAGDKLI